MGNYFYKMMDKISNDEKFAVIFSVIIGLLCHIYKIVNYLPNHDSIYNYYSSQNVVGSGRWFLSIACGFSSYYDLPWITGFLSILFISFTVAVLVRIFSIENRFLISLVSGLLVCSPSITETLFFGFTSDGYMLAMLFSALAVLLSDIKDDSKIHFILSTILITLTCATYQSYISFSLVLLVCLCIWNLLFKEYQFKEYIHWIARELIKYIIALISFYIIWKLCLHFEGIEINNYQGINSMSLNFTNIILAIPSSIKALYFYFLEWNVLKHGLTLYGFLNVLFLCFAFGVLVSAIYKKNIYKDIYKLVLIFISIGLLPFICCIWNFVTPNVIYRPMMLTCVVLIFILTLIIANQIITGVKVELLTLISIIMICNNAVNANISYFYMNQEYYKSYATGLEMVSRVQMIGSNYKVLVLGDLADEKLISSNSYNYSNHLLNQLLEINLLFDQEHTLKFINNTFDVKFKSVSASQKNIIKSNPIVDNMKPFPDKSSVQLIDDVIVIKLSDKVSEDK